MSVSTNDAESPAAQTGGPFVGLAGQEERIMRYGIKVADVGGDIPPDYDEHTRLRSSNRVR